MGIFYPESAPDGFRDIIESWLVPAALVLHEADKEHEKPHYHLLLSFCGKKSLTQVRELMEELGSKLVQPVQDLRGAARYLRHLDQPDKQQYPPDAVEAFSGFDIASLAAPVRDFGPEVRALCRKEDIYYYSELMDLVDSEQLECASWCQNHTVHLKGYLTSAEYQKRAAQLRR